MEETVIEMTRPLLSQTEDDEEMQRKFVSDYYNEAKERNRREEGIYISDLLFDTIPYATSGNNIVWWIAEDHPLAIMLNHNYILSKGEICESLGNVNSPLGKINKRARFPMTLISPSALIISSALIGCLRPV